VSAHEPGPSYGDYRTIKFFDTTGKELPKWKDSDGKEWDSQVLIRYPSMSVTEPAREVTIPDGHEIVGFAVETDP